MRPFKSSAETTKLLKFVKDAAHPIVVVNQVSDGLRDSEWEARTLYSILVHIFVRTDTIPLIISVNRNPALEDSVKEHYPGPFHKFVVNEGDNRFVVPHERDHLMLVCLENLVLLNTLRLKKQTKYDGYIILGDMPEAWPVLHMSNKKPVFWLHPNSGNDEKDGLVRIAGEDGKLENIIQGMCAGLLVDKEVIKLPAILHDSSHQIVVTSDQVSHGVYTSKRKFDKHTRLTRNSFDFNQVWKLVQKVLSTLRKEGHVSARSAVVFIHDPGAPGGSQIREIIKRKDPNHPILERAFTLRIDSRIEDPEGERAVRGWLEGGEPDYNGFDKFILIDSVTFSGNTLLKIREWLEYKSGHRGIKFVAATLLMPKDTLKAFDGTWEVKTAKEFTGFEVLFPWGWTRATGSVTRPDLKNTDEFAAEVGFLPKKWGLQLEFNQNEKVSINVLSMERGQRISFQYHNLRDETFYVLDSRIRVRLWDTYLTLNRNESLRIPAGTPHQLIALDEPCRILEISEGLRLQGEDIVRLEDPHERKISEDGSHNGRS